MRDKKIGDVDKMELWLKPKSDKWDGSKELITAAMERGFDTVVLKPEDASKASKLGNIRVGQELDADDQKIEKIKPEKVGGKDLVLAGVNGEGDGTLDAPKKIEESKDLEIIRNVDADKKGEFVLIDSKDKERFAKSIAEPEEVDYIVVKGSDWKIIPLENLIAELQQVDVDIIASVKDAEEGKTAMEVLEVGVDGVLLESGNMDEILKLSKMHKNLDSGHLNLQKAEIKKIKEVGMGDRVCVDSCTLMEEGEGMLVGSSSSCLFLVHSESIDSEYADPRPFRVNAGGVHSYIMVPEGKTMYLSELGAGDEVLVVNKEGGTSTAIVGRSKVERRPMLLIEAEISMASKGERLDKNKEKEVNEESKRFKVILQNAETIRLVNGKGCPVSISELEVGDSVLVYTEEGGRHFGKDVDETIIEK